MVLLADGYLNLLCLQIAVALADCYLISPCLLVAIVLTYSNLFLPYRVAIAKGALVRLNRNRGTRRYA